MKCPYLLEPHQIQGLEFISIFPVIQWLVNESVKLRNEKAERLKRFAVGRFHNHFSLTSSAEDDIEKENARKAVMKIEDLYAAKRQYKRKQNIEPDNEYSRVRLTLLEYGIKNVATRATSKKLENTKSQDGIKENDADLMEQEDVSFSFNLLHCNMLFAFYVA